MDKQAIRRSGIAYRASLSDASVRLKSQYTCQQLNKLLQTLPPPYLSYTALLPGELNPAEALRDFEAIFIQPQRDAPTEYENFSTVIIPMVAADSYGNRIGMGGGWFDAFLRAHPEATLVGCCYDQMIVTHVPSESHDIPMDYICTETKIIHCRVE